MVVFPYPKLGESGFGFGKDFSPLFNDMLIYWCMCTFHRYNYDLFAKLYTKYQNIIHFIQI